MYLQEKCPCGKSCCKNGTCSSCAVDALGNSDSAGATNGFRFGRFVIGVLIAILLGTMIASNVKKYKFIGVPVDQPHILSVNGEGKVTATPNIAMTTVGLVTEKITIADAQSENSQKMNALIAAMQQLGISNDDIKTSQYQMFPKYSYDQKNGSTITGYSVTQSVDVKIRDLTKISAVLAKAGEIGANQVSGIQFTVDDPKILRAAAREAAVKDARLKAEKLAAELGVKLGSVIAFNESASNGGPRPMMFEAFKSGAASDASPSIQSGSLDIETSVTITYEILN